MEIRGRLVAIYACASPLKIATVAVGGVFRVLVNIRNGEFPLTISDTERVLSVDYSELMADATLEISAYKKSKEVMDQLTVTSPELTVPSLGVWMTVIS